MVITRAKEKAEFYFTTVQRDEIEAFKDKDPPKYQYVQEVIEKVPVEEACILEHISWKMNILVERVLRA
jgi:hypothetical protein